jgi:hypothetical protein
MDTLRAWAGVERRREARAPASGNARYMLANYPERGWASCRLVDLSRRGAGFVLFGEPRPRYAPERRLLIQLDADGSTGDPTAPLLALVRHVGVTPEGWLRLGVEFITDNERPDPSEQAGARA